jgi:hypothetical protein
MNSHSNTQNDDVLLRYMNFVENSVPIIRECMEYISVSETHLYEAVTRNTNERYYHNTYREAPMRPPFNSRRRERSPSYDENSNINNNTRHHNINNNRLRRNRNDGLNTNSNIFTNSNSEPYGQNDNPNNLLNYMNSLQNIMGSGQNNNNTNNFLANLIPHLTPVIVRPTQNQISTACETIEFGTIENPPNSNCPITIEPFNSEDIVTRIKYCGHCFKTEALNRWFTNNVRCPMCRYDIRTYINHQNLNNRSTNEEPISLETPSTEPILSETPQMDPSVNILYTTVQYYSTLPNEREDENQENNQTDNS